MMNALPPRVRRRQSLNRKASQLLLEKIPAFKFKVNKIEEAETLDGLKVYILDNELTLFVYEDMLYPFLKCPCVDYLPSALVDMGAIPFVCKGADVMAPGIKEIRGVFNEGDTVVVRDMKYGKALSIGKALKSSSEIMVNKKGKVIRNLHYVGDKLWELQL